MHPTIIKFASSQLCTSIDGELQSRLEPRFGPLSRSVPVLSVAERQREQTTLILRQTRAHSVPDHSGIVLPDCTRARAAAGSSLDSSAVCAVATEYEMQQDCASAGRIMVVGPAAEFGARAPIEDEDRGIVRSRQIYRWAVEPFIVAQNTVYRLVQIFRDHIPTPPSRFVFSLDALIFRVRTG